MTKTIFDRFRSRCAGALIPALVALHMAMPCAGQDMLELIWAQQLQNWANAPFLNFMAGMQKIVAESRARQEAAAQYRAMFSGLTVSGKRAEYQKFRQEVEAYVRSGNAEGLWNLIMVKLWPIKENAEVIGGDCAQLMSYCDNFTAEVDRRMQNQTMMLQQMMNNSSGPKMHEFKCYRCGATYVGRFSCPNCSGPKYY